MDDSGGSRRSWLLMWLCTAFSGVMLLAACGDTDDASGSDSASDGRRTPSVMPTEPVTRPPAPVSTYDVDESGALDHDEFRPAIADAISGYRWPPAYTVTDAIVMERLGGSEGVFEPGLERTIIGKYNRCAWTLTWLDAQAASDTRLADEAVEQFHRLAPETNPPSWFLDLADKAALGDPSKVQQYVEANGCATYPWSDEA